MMRRYCWFYIALIVSVLIHLGILFSDMFHLPKVQPKLKPLTVKMQAFRLSSPEPKPKVSKPAPPKLQDQPNPTPKATPKLTPKPKLHSKKVAPPKPTQGDRIGLGSHTMKEEKQPKIEPQQASEPISNPASEPLYNADGSLNANNPKAWQQLTPKPNPKAKAKNPLVQNLDTQASIPVSTPIKVEHTYDTIAPSTKPPFPQDAILRYQGPYSITGSMTFHRTASTYKITAVFNIPFYKMEFLSEGKIDGTTLIPLRYIDKRRGNVYASANFDYDTHTIHFGKGETPQRTAPMTGHQYDFFSWAWQMAIDGGNIPGTIQITNGKTIYQQDNPGAPPTADGETLYDTGEGKIRVIQFTIDRNHNSHHDTIGYGFAPDFANIPALIQFDRDGTEYEMHIIGINLDGHNYWQAIRHSNRKHND